MSYVYIYSECSRDWHLLREPPTKVFTTLDDAKRLSVPDRPAKDWVRTDPNTWTLFEDNDREGEEQGEIRKVKVSEP